MFGHSLIQSNLLLLEKFRILNERDKGKREWKLNQDPRNELLYFALVVSFIFTTIGSSDH